MRNSIDGYFASTDDYETGYLTFKNNMTIRFVLPKENVPLNDFIKDETKLREALNNQHLEYSTVNYKIPKFSYKSSFALINYAKTLGIVSAFSDADFSALTDTDLFVSKMFQKTFIEINEFGGRAGAYTAIVGDEKADSGEPVDFTLNRPFVYAIFSGEYPIFIGAVKDPNNHGEYQY
jgi:serpin B